MIAAAQETSEAVFVVDGEVATPRGHAAGPWDAELQHGSAPAALVARLTIDLMRAVPREEPKGFTVLVVGESNDLSQARSEWQAAVRRRGRSTSIASRLSSSQVLPG